jgi:hypothetical protein
LRATCPYAARLSTVTTAPSFPRKASGPCDLPILGRRRPPVSSQSGVASRRLARLTGDGLVSVAAVSRF